MEKSFYCRTSLLEKDSLFGGNSFSSLSFLECLRKMYIIWPWCFSSFSFFEDNGGKLVGLKPTQIVSNIQIDKGF